MLRPKLLTPVLMFREEIVPHFRERRRLQKLFFIGSGSKALWRGICILSGEPSEFPTGREHMKCFLAILGCYWPILELENFFYRLNELLGGHTFELGVTSERFTPSVRAEFTAKSFE